MNIEIWPGSSSFAAVSSSWYVSGSQPKPTSFGYYDNDSDFKLDADRVADYCAYRLGYPIMDVELQDVNFYRAFETATTVYGSELYSFRIRDNYLSLEGFSTGSNINNAIITPNLSNIIRIAEQYGAEAGVGGNVTWYSGSIALTSSLQDYDLNEWAINNNISSSDIEIKRIFYEESPAVTRFFDPYAGSGMGNINLINNFGWGGQSPAVQFMLMPLSFDVQVIQAIEFNDQIRKSGYSFELINNKLRIFPIPQNCDGLSIWFQYIKKSDRILNTVTQSPSNVTNISNVPYDHIIYSSINKPGRAWIMEYTVCIAKEMLGNIRDKYKEKPIPNANITLNGTDLLNQAQDEKNKLIERLRTYFDETSRKALLERQSQEHDFVSKTLSNIPNIIYIG